ncbi:hypothetical protein GCM10010116_06750 [Microbispora rosea subsp. aerata]|nr:hypothetical protein [Microbispora rosea]GGO03422.1 hypothetical protein GCM10010116_06750 [Microbispora rosea subsp. aerata]GIH54808.1 hypothetical protein Mro02_17220 [Microbispora rosea subsp. aerata]GLJ83718.1 hypothetical protein GCM10017588_24460 [Microbispora rosea subsp. aerata]
MVQRVIVPALFPPPRYAHAAVVEAGRRLAFTAGAVPLDGDGKIVEITVVAAVPGDAES